MEDKNMQSFAYNVDSEVTRIKRFAAIMVLIVALFSSPLVLISLSYTLIMQTINQHRLISLIRYMKHLLMNGITDQSIWMLMNS